MPRTGSEMLRNTRELLHDTGRGFSTVNTMYTDEEVLLGLNEAKRRITKALISRPTPAYVTLSRLAKTATGSTGTAVPADFWYLQAGIKTDNTYVPRVLMGIGEPLVGAGHDLIYVKAGTFFGAANTALYWSYPTQKITTAPATLTEFCDGVYDACELLAARELVAQEQSDATDRWKFFTDLFMEAIATFQ